MKNLHIHIEVNPELYLKDPESSELGRRIITGSIEMINRMGFEVFTFKKLGERIGSPESSIYRYFENKHTLLLYLINWYWSWMEYRLVFATANIESPEQRLREAVKILTRPVEGNSNLSPVDNVLLDEIIIRESIKAYHTKEVDEENRKGYFKSYMRIVQRVSDMITEINPQFEYPHMLTSTIIEGAHHQRYFAEHLPTLTDAGGYEGDPISEFYIKMAFNTIEK